MRETGTAGFGASTGSGQGGAGALDGLLGEAISSAARALDVFDFKTAAAQRLPPAHYGYLATGVDGEATLRANREGFERLFLRPRRLVDVTELDTTTTLFGVDWETPIVLAPAGSQRAFHPDAELASARAARAKRHLQILSTVTSTPVEDVVDARGEPVWYQLYPTSRWPVTQALLRRVEDAGCPVVALTVDMPAPSNRETVERYRRLDDRDCTACHPAPDVAMRNKPMYRGTEMTGVADFFASGLTWDFVARLRDATDMKVVLKGIVTREDAGRCLENGVDGIIVSNHGGRAEESGRGTIESLPEVVEAVGGAIPIMIDGGFRRGTDVFKALALGANAICIGRPYLWGLGAFGQPGVEKVLDILRAELETVMRLMGAPTLKGIGSSFVGET
jgi:isopentenyl diphosphate isomerase/L-lactate dehydrogenase-like FMN-dependent dehydrogenase